MAVGSDVGKSRWEVKMGRSTSYNSATVSISEYIGALLIFLAMPQTISSLFKILIFLSELTPNSFIKFKLDY
jgi:hypothetical protein